jgi:surface carbohydrate biosynthesis protein
VIGKWIYLPIEVQHREFTSKLLFACVAAERGYNVVIGERSRMRSLIETLPNGVFVEKSLGATSTHFDEMKSYRDAGHLVVISDEESPSIYSIPDAWVDFRISENVLDQVNFFFSWGKEQENIIRKQLSLGESKFRTTGSHRVDVWQKPACLLHQHKADKIIKKYGKYILFPSNFAYKLDPRGYHYHFDKARARGGYDTPKRAKYYWDSVINRDEVYDAIRDNLQSVVDAFPEYKLIIRPHPNESVDLWKAFIGDIENTEVVYEGEVSPWLLGSSAMFHNGCTTALEYRMMGRQPVSFRPVSNEVYDDSFLMNMGPVATTADELIVALQRTLDGEDVEFTLSKDFDNLICSGDDKMACERMIDVIDTLEISAGELHRNLRQKYLNWREKFRKEETKEYSRSAQQKRHSETAPPKWHGTHVDVIDQQIKGFSELFGRFDNVRSENFDRRLYIIQAKG